MMPEDYLNIFALWQWAYLAIFLVAGLCALYVVRHWKKCGKQWGLLKWL